MSNSVGEISYHEEASVKNMGESFSYSEERERVV